MHFNILSVKMEHIVRAKTKALSILTDNSLLCSLSMKL